MKAFPFTLKRAQSLYEKGFSVPWILECRRAFSPWELYQRIEGQGPHSFFLDSLSFLPPAQRFSYLGGEPWKRLSYQNGVLRLEGEKNRSWRPWNFLSELRKLFSTVRVPPGRRFDFFSGGAVGYWGYELAREFDRVRFRKKPGPALPDLALSFFRDLIVFDHRRGCYLLITWLIPEKGISFSRAFREAEGRQARLWSTLSETGCPPLNGHFELLDFRPEISRQSFCRMVLRAKEYIRSGDIYQANLSQRFSFRFKGSFLRLYGRLREANPAPFCALLRMGDLVVASSSPELLVEKKGNLCRTSPIAGTRPRGHRPEETRRLVRELFTNEKERAEHLMLVDLERNDLGRVSRWRSVRVRDFMRVERYARVLHLVSEITSRLKPSEDAWDVIRAMFPGGTITGCPKIRSMEIIDELEPVGRGIYTGSIGYVGFDGDLELNIAIRTLVLKGKRGHLQVGAGIVADSDPDREYEETLAKGEALAEALVAANC